MFCEHCGKEIAEGTRICPYCLSQQSTMSNQTAAPQQENADQPEKTEVQSNPDVSADYTINQQGATPNGGAYQQYRNNGYQVPSQPYASPVSETDTKPIGTWAFFGYSLLFGLPMVGFILQIIFSCIDVNVNLKHFARSRLLLAALWFILSIVFITLIITFIGQFAYEIVDAMENFTSF